MMKILEASNTYVSAEPTLETVKNKFQNYSKGTTPNDINTNNSKQDYNKPMSNITREEFDAKLETIEARMDARLVSIEGKIDTFLALSDEREKSNKERFTHLDKSFSEVVNSSKDFKYWLIGTALAIVVGLYSANNSLVQNMFTSFQAGGNTSTFANQTNEALKDVSSSIKELAEKVEAQDKKLNDKQVDKQKK